MDPKCKLKTLPRTLHSLIPDPSGPSHQFPLLPFLAAPALHLFPFLGISWGISNPRPHLHSLQKSVPWDALCKPPFPQQGTEERVWCPRSCVISSRSLYLSGPVSSSGLHHSALLGRNQAVNSFLQKSHPFPMQPRTWRTRLACAKMSTQKKHHKFDRLNKDRSRYSPASPLRTSPGIYFALNLDTVLTRVLIWLSGPQPSKSSKLDAQDATGAGRIDNNKK